MFGMSETSRLLVRHVIYLRKARWELERCRRKGLVCKVCGQPLYSSHHQHHRECYVKLERVRRLHPELSAEEVLTEARLVCGLTEPLPR